MPKSEFVANVFDYPDASEYPEEEFHADVPIVPPTVTPVSKVIEAIMKDQKLKPKALNLDSTEKDIRESDLASLNVIHAVLHSTWGQVTTIPQALELVDAQLKFLNERHKILAHTKDDDDVVGDGF